MSLPPLSVTVNTRRWSCILDTGLALSRYGMLLAQRLGEEFDLWLVRELWRILDNIECYCDPEQLLSESCGAHSGASNDSLRGTLKQWEWARTASDLTRLKLFWVGDAMYESLFPPGIDGNLVYRYEKLAASFQDRDQGHNGRESNLFMEDSFRDAVALTAALSPYRAFILTSYCDNDSNSHKSPPPICSYIGNTLKLDPVKLGDDNRFLKEYLHPILLRAGVNELLWAGVKLAAVHLLVPHAVVMPSPVKDENYFAEEFEPHGGEKDWWREASCFWYPI